MGAPSDDDGITTADGTAFAIFSEHVRGEPRWYYVMRRLPGELAYERWPYAPEGSTDKRVARRRMQRCARRHEGAKT